MPTKKRTRRTADQRIKDLKAQIEEIKQREAAREAKKDPALRHIAGALRSVDKAAEATGDAATRKALSEVRATLAACLTLNGAAPSAKKVRRPRAEVPEASAVLSYIKEHPGASSADMCAKFDTDAATLRPVLHALRDDRKVKVSGKARATQYSPA